ncbi:hypothetical protein K438DRAFT_1988372 [Mycena galopus ATCC 62051]|nr:hypothetical protein K438DRAFT_1988372 [Mycena galopus ATCC 62051]
MKFSTTLTVLLASVTASFAQQVIVSPTPGQVISTHTAVSRRADLVKIDVVISEINASFPFPGGLPIGGLTPTSIATDGSSIYSTLTNPIVIDGAAPGNRLVAVVEYFNQAGGEPGLDVVFVPVTFV